MVESGYGVKSKPDVCRINRVIPLLAAANIYWFFLPLVITISLVFSATRHEQLQPILSGALRTAIWLLIFVVAFFAFLFIVSWWN